MKYDFFIDFYVLIMVYIIAVLSITLYTSYDAVSGTNIIPFVTIDSFNTLSVMML